MKVKRIKKENPFNRYVQKSNFNPLGKSKQIVRKGKSTQNQLDSRRNSIKKDFDDMKRNNIFKINRDEMAAPPSVRFHPDQGKNFNQAKSNPIKNLKGMKKPKSSKFNLDDEDGLVSFNGQVPEFARPEKKLNPYDKKRKRIADIVARDKASKKRRKKENRFAESAVEAMNMGFSDFRGLLQSEEVNFQPNDDQHQNTDDDFLKLVKEMENDARAKPAPLKKLSKEEASELIQEFENQDEEVEDEEVSADEEETSDTADGFPKSAEQFASFVAKVGVDQLKDTFLHENISSMDLNPILEYTMQFIYNQFHELKDPEPLLKFLFGLANKMPKKFTKYFVTSLEEMKSQMDEGRELSLRYMIDVFIITQFYTQTKLTILSTLGNVLCEYLSQVVYRCHSNISQVLFLSNILLQRFDSYFPEVLVALCHVLLLAFPESIRVQIPLSMPELRTEEDFLLVPKEKTDSLLSIREDILIPNPNFDEKWKVRCILTALSLIRKVSDITKDSTSYPAIFEPVCAILKNLKAIKPVRRTTKVTLKLIQQQSKLVIENRIPLKWLTVAPKSLKMIEPMIYDDPSSIRDPNVQRAGQKILKKKVKRLKREAARELRKDSQFMRAIQEQETKEQQYEAKQKYKTALSMIQQERSESHQLDTSHLERRKTIRAIHARQKKRKPE